MAKEVSLYVDEEIYKKYKKVCIDLDISPSKNMTALLNNFVDLQFDYQERIKQVKEK